MQFIKTSALVLALSVCGSSFAQTVRDYTTAGANYTENFDALTAAWDNNAPTMNGWSFYRGPLSPTGSNAFRDPTLLPVTALIVSSGTSTSGAVYSFGATGAPDRALGALGSNSYGDMLLVLGLKNTTGTTLTEFTLNHAFEQWRNGGNTTAHTLEFDYRVSSSATLNPSDTDAVAPGFTIPGGTFIGLSLFNTAVAAAIDGNTAGRVENVGGTITGINWAPDTVLVLRWWRNNSIGNDHGIALDDLVFRASAGSATPTISGNLVLQNTDDDGAAGTETIGWTLSDGTISYNGTVSVNDFGGGAYSFPIPTGAPNGAYTLRFKGGTFLASAYNVTLTGSSLTQAVSLRNGNIDQDSEVGPSDFEAVVAQFGGPGEADCDNNGEVGPSDFEIVNANFSLEDQ